MRKFLVAMVVVAALVLPASAQSEPGYYVFMITADKSTTYAFTGPFNENGGPRFACADAASYLNRAFNEYFECRYGSYEVTVNSQYYYYYVERTTWSGTTSVFAGPLKSTSHCEGFRRFLDRNYADFFTCVYR